MGLKYTSTETLVITQESQHQMLRLCTRVAQPFSFLGGVIKDVLALHAKGYLGDIPDYWSANYLGLDLFSENLNRFWPRLQEKLE